MKKFFHFFFIAVVFCCCQLPATLFAQVTHNESFDGIKFPPTGWSWFGNDSAFLFRATLGSSPAQTPHSGAGELEWNSWNVPSGNWEYLATPMISWSGRGSNTPTVSFWFYRDTTNYNT